MSRNRVLAMEQIRRLNEPDLDVVLVTPENLGEWIVPGHPLHPAYEDLALIHRSDYLRAYLLHHHGGGYTDVKAAQHRWRPMLDELNRDQDAWLLGYRELSYRFVAPAEPRTHRRLLTHHARLLGNGAYIVRPRTPFTRAWLAEAERRLDGWEEALGSSPGDVFGGPRGYPLPFYGLLGEIFHPCVSTTTIGSGMTPASPPSCATTSDQPRRATPSSDESRPHPLARSAPAWRAGD